MRWPHSLNRRMILVAWMGTVLLVCGRSTGAQSVSIPSRLDLRLSAGSTSTVLLSVRSLTTDSVRWTLSERSDTAFVASPPLSDETVALAADADARRRTVPAPIHWNRPHEPNTLIVRFRDGARARSTAHKVVGRGVRISRSYRSFPADVARIAPGQAIREIAERYRNHPDVLYVSPNYRLRLSNDVTPPPEPNDPSYGLQWHLEAQNDADIDAPEGWAVTHSAEQVTIAIVDSGIDLDHPDLEDNLWANPLEIQGVPGVDDDGNGIVDDIHGATWTNFDGTPTGTPPDDGHGHGTHVAGIAGARGDNATGTVGVCWRTRLMALKVIKDNGDGYDTDAIAAIEYAIQMGARLINASWGGAEATPALRDVIAAAGDRGILLIAAAGNDRWDNDENDHYPSNFDLDNVIAVGSTDSRDGRYFTSNWGPLTVDLAAPGAGIYSTTNNQTYRYLSGTSMATPMVTGAAALLMDRAPEATVLEIRHWLLDSVDVLDGWENFSVSEGRLNVGRALAFVTIPWLEPAWRSGELGGEETALIPLRIDTQGRVPGERLEGRLVWARTDSDERVIISVQLTVEEPGEKPFASQWLVF